MKNFYVKSLIFTAISTLLILASIDGVSAGDDTLQLSDNDSPSSNCVIYPILCRKES
jgi:hypothetical protein